MVAMVRFAIRIVPVITQRLVGDQMADFFCPIV
jgi:hypothetical protein